jgi:flavin-binding protein dodecin
MSVAKVIEIIGNSEKSWEDAANNAIKTASETLRNISGVEIVGQNATIKNGEIDEYRSVVKIAFEYEVNKKLDIE